MTKEGKKLLKSNLEKEKKISPENMEAYNDIILYLRYADLSRTNQEEVRSDILDMIIDGQHRGEGIRKVLGTNYKKTCDEIIESMPRRSKKEKMTAWISMLLSELWIMILICVAVAAAKMIGNGFSMYMELRLSDVLMFFVIPIIAFVIISVLHKRIFKFYRGHAAVTYLIVFLLVLVAIGIGFLCNVYAGMVLAKVHFAIAIGAFLVFFIAERITDTMY